MKSKGWIITGIVAASVAAVLLIGVMVVMLSGQVNWFNRTLRTSENVIYEESFSRVTDISISSACGDISFIENTDNRFGVLAYGEKREDITVNFSDGKLSVDYPQKRRLINWTIAKNNIVISLPKGYDKSIKVNADYGDVTLCALPKASVNVECDYGNVEIAESVSAAVSNDCGNVEIGTIDTADVRVDLGDIRLDTVTKRCDLRNDCGDITVKNMKITEDSVISNDLGDITVEHAPDVRVTADTDMGKVNVAQTNEKASVMLTITNSSGNINVGK